MRVVRESQLALKCLSPTGMYFGRVLEKAWKLRIPLIDTFYILRRKLPEEYKKAEEKMNRDRLVWFWRQARIVNGYVPKYSK